MLSAILFVFASRTQGLISPKNFTVPFPIYSPKQGSQSPVILFPSTCDSEAELTFSFATPAKISKGFIISIEIFGESHSLKVDQDWNELETINLTFPYVKTASEPGIYYLSVEIKVTDFGQIVALNQAYLAVFLASKRPESKDFPISTTLKFNWGERIYFKFELSIRILPKTGIITLFFDENFRIDELSEFEIDGNETFQNITLVKNFEKNIIKIQFLNENSTEFSLVTIQVNGVKSPESIVNTAKVTAEVTDQETSTILEVFTAEASIQNIRKIEIKSWDAVITGSDYIISGLVRFMKLSFKSEVDLPESNKIEIKFENVNITKFSYLTESNQDLKETVNGGSSYLFSNYKSLICSLTSSSSVSCEISEKISAGSLIEVYTLTEFLGTEGKVTSIVVSDKKNSVLGRTNEIFIKTYSNKHSLLENLRLFITLNSTYPEISQSNNNSILPGYIYITFELPESTSGSDILTISSLFTENSIQQPEKISLTSPLVSRFSYSNNFTSPYEFDNPPEISEGILKLDLSGAELIKGNSIHILITSTDYENPKVTLPLFPSSNLTKFETFFLYSTSSASYIFSKPFTVASQPLKTSEIRYFCSVLQYPNLLTVKFASFVEFEPTEDVETFLELWFRSENDFAENFGSGLMAGDEYPAKGLKEGDFLFLMNIENTGYSAGLKMNLNLGFDKSDNNFIFPLFQAEEFKGYSVTFKFTARKDNNFFDIFSSTVEISSNDKKMIETKEKSYQFGTRTNDNTVIFQDLFNEPHSGNIALFFPEFFRLIGEETIWFDPGLEFGRTFFISKGEKFKVNLILLNISYPSQYAHLYISKLLVGDITGKLNFFILYLPDDLNGECLLFNQYFVYVPTTLHIDILKITPDIFTAAGPESLEIEFETILELPYLINFTTNHKIQLSLNSEFEKIIECDMIDPHRYLKTRIEDKTCIITTNNSLKLHHFFVKFKIIPPTIYDETNQTFFSNITFDLMSFLFFNMNSANSNNFIKFIKSTAPPAPNVTYFKVFPDVLTNGFSDMYLSFVPDYEIPANSLIQIKGINFEDDPIAYRHTWITCGFVESYVNLGILYIKTFSNISKGNYAHIYKRNAFIFKEEGISEIFVFITYNNIYLVKDSASVSSNIKKVSIKKEVPNKFTELSFYKDVLSVNEYTFYDFSLRVDFVFTKMNIIIFDYVLEQPLILGDIIEKYFDEKNVFYLKTNETQTECLTLYWKLVCRFYASKSVNQDINLKFRLLNTKNQSKYNISVYILDSNETILSYKTHDDSTKASPKYSVLDFHLKNTHETNLNGIDLLFSIGSLKNILENERLVLSFPNEFHINLFNPNINCELKHSSNDSTSLNFYYSVYLNEIDIKFLSNISLNENDSIIIKVADIKKPVDSFNVSKELSTRGSKLWTNQVHCKLISFKNKSLIARTASNWNQVHISYNNSRQEKIKIFCQGRENLIILHLQTSVFCRISPRSESLKARSLQIIPTSELEFDRSSYSLKTYKSSTVFQVGAPYYLNPGTYYISWLLIEDPFMANESLYNVMELTEVQIYPYSKVYIKVDFNYSFINSKTLPALVSLHDFFPISPLSITVKLEPDDGKFELNGNEIILTEERNFGYFQVFANESKGRELSSSDTKIVFTLQGKYLDGFEMVDEIEFNPDFIQSESIIKSSLIWVKENNTGKLKLSLNDSANVIWVFGPKESLLINNISSTDWILEKIYPFYDPPTELQSTLEVQEKTFEDYLNVIQLSNWIQFQEDRKELISTFLFYDQVFLTSGDHILFETCDTIPTLDYMALAWIQKNSEFQSQITWSGQTDEFLDHCNFTIKSRGSIKNMTQNLSLAFKVLEERFLFIDEKINNDSIFISQFLLLSDYSIKVSPWKIVDDVKKGELQEYFQDVQILSLKYKNLSREDYGIPAFVDIDSRIESNNLMISSYSEIKSFVCCIAEYEPDRNRTLSIRDLQYFRHKNVEFVSFDECYENLYKNFTFSIPLSFFKTPGDYQITCIMCNQYPMNPLCTDSNTSYFYDLSVSEIADSGIWIEVSLLIVLIF